MMKFSKLRKFMPLLYLHIEFPLFEVKTALMLTRIETETIEYTMFHFRIYKWKFAMSLYGKQGR